MNSWPLLMDLFWSEGFVPLELYVTDTFTNNIKCKFLNFWTCYEDCLLKSIYVKLCKLM